MPYSPQATDRRGEFYLQDHGGAIRAQGLLSAVQSLSSDSLQAINMYRAGKEMASAAAEKSKTISAQNKAFETLLKTGGTQLGIQPEQIDQILADSPEESPAARNARLTTMLQGLFAQRELASKSVQDQLAQTKIAGDQQQQRIQAQQLLEGLSQRGRMRSMYGGTPSTGELDAMLQGGDSFGDLTPGQPPSSGAEGVRRALGAGVLDPQLLDSIGRYTDPNGGKSRFQPGLQDYGKDAFGRPVQALQDAQGNNKYIEPPKDGTESGSPLNKLIRERDAYQAAGRADIVQQYDKAIQSYISRYDLIPNGGDGETKPVVVTSQKQFDALPKGARFIFNGKSGTKNY